MKKKEGLSLTGEEEDKRSTGSTNVNSSSPVEDDEARDAIADKLVQPLKTRKYSLHGITSEHVKNKKTTEKFYERWFSGKSKTTAAALQSFSSRMSLASLNASSAGNASRRSGNTAGKLASDLVHDPSSGATSGTNRKRRIVVNIKQPSSTRDRYGRLPQYPTNKICTSKYTLVNFVPKNLFEQFHRVANIYFLSLVILQVFPQFNNGGNKIMPAIPIMTIVFLTAMKDAYEDYQRHRIDNDLNNKKATLLGNWRNRNKSRNSGCCSRFLHDILFLLRLKRPFSAQRLESGDRCASKRRISLAGGRVANSKLDLTGKQEMPAMTELSFAEHAEAQGSSIGIIAATDMDADAGPQDQSNPVSRAPSVSDGLKKDSMMRTSTFFSLQNGISNDSSEPPSWQETTWQKVHVGDIVLLKNSESIPCDLVLLTSSNEDHGAFIETKNLDGETNLKPKGSLSAFQQLQTPQEYAGVKFVIDCEAPTTDLYSFNACLIYSTESGDDFDRLVANYDPTMLANKHIVTASVTIDNFLPRGTTLKNTDWAIGVAVATGKDTKVLLNSGSLPSKRSRIEVLLNPMVYINFVILAVMCLVTVAVYSRKYAHWRNDGVNFAVTDNSVAVSSIYTFFNALIIYQNLVPISLYVTLEVVMTGLAWFIYQDCEMYYAPTDTRCTPKTWNVSDDLGQIEYVFTDKTGTLTCNQMEFRRCSIAGKCYGSELQEETRSEHSNSDAEEESDDGDFDGDGSVQQMCELLDDIAPNPYRTAMAAIPFVDVNVVHHMRDTGSFQSEKISQFWLFLALCHSLTTPKVTEHADGRNELDYKAQSPDELCLVTAAKDMGFVFLGRERKQLRVKVQGKLQLFEDLATLDFNSTRKRMSVVVRDVQTKKIYLICKGADNVIYERLAQTQMISTVSGSPIIPSSDTPLIVQQDADEVSLSSSNGGRAVTLAPHYDATAVGLNLPALPEIKEPSNVAYPKSDPNLVSRTGETGKNLAALDDDDLQLEIQANSLLHIEKFACDGLRTLGVAYRELSEEIYAKFAARYHDARTSLTGRDTLVADLAEEYETNLTLLGATGIEDKLQGRVPESISQLRAAGVKVWVLTGDKVETAINIGVTCNLVSPQMNLIVLKGNSYEQVCETIKLSLEQLLPEAHGPSTVRTRTARKHVDSDIEVAHGLVIDGQALRTVLSDKTARKGFLVLATLCNSVICCRVSPKQKAQVVKLVKHSLNAMCLSIGDGANDVSMIHEAHVGVGIAGQEGLQAAMSSDFAIAQFRFLTRLMLLHGRWSYTRMSQMIMVFWYKNIVWVFAQFWFQIYTGFSASLLYDYTFMMFYNLFFASLPGFAIGFFDQDVGEYFALNVPQLYRTGIDQKLFSFGRFWLFVVDALYQSLVIFFVNYGAFHNWISGEGRSVDLYIMGTSTALNAIIIVNVYHWLHLRRWNWIATLLMFLSMAAAFIYLPIYTAFPGTALSGLGNTIWQLGLFWLVLLLNIVICFLPNISVKYIARMLWPKDIDIVREVEKYHKNTDHVVQDEGGGVSGVSAAIHKQTGLVKRKLTQENLHLNQFIQHRRSQSLVASPRLSHQAVPSSCVGRSDANFDQTMQRLSSFESSAYNTQLPPVLLLSKSRNSSEYLPLPFTAKTSLELRNSSMKRGESNHLLGGGFADVSNGLRPTGGGMHSRRGVSFSENSPSSSHFSSSFFPGYRHNRTASGINFTSSTASVRPQPPPGSVKNVEPTAPTLTKLVHFNEKSD